jgi:hypothetical protein
MFLHPEVFHVGARERLRASPRRRRKATAFSVDCLKSIPKTAAQFGWSKWLEPRPSKKRGPNTRKMSSEWAASDVFAEALWANGVQ